MNNKLTPAQRLALETIQDLQTIITDLKAKLSRERERRQGAEKDAERWRLLIAGPEDSLTVWGDQGWYLQEKASVAIRSVVKDLGEAHLRMRLDFLQAAMAAPSSRPVTNGAGTGPVAGNVTGEEHNGEGGNAT